MFLHLTDTTKALIFYSIAFALAVLVTVLAPLIGAGAGFVTMFTPLIAVLIMLLVVTRDGYSRAGWRSLGLHRAGLRGWPLALLGPALVLGCTYALAWQIGVGSFVALAGGSADLALNLLVDLLIGGLIGGLGEEIGWRGYFLPHLLPLGRRRALLLSGLLHGVWHMPLLLLTPFYHGLGDRWIVVPLFLLTLTAAGMFYGYLRLTTESVWPAAIAHSSFNVFWDMFSKLTVAVSPLALEYLAGETGVFTLLGTAVVSGWLVYRLDRRAARLTMYAEPAARA
jgi:membrane protease YdiL (CAAX protease family)